MKGEPSLETILKILEENGKNIAKEMIETLALEKNCVSLGLKKDGKKELVFGFRVIFPDCRGLIKVTHGKILSY